MNTNKTTNITFSIMKGIAIISVVVGHVFVRTDIEEFVNQYHLAVFFFVAGYFFKDKYIQSPWQFIKKRIKSLYFPFVILCSIFLFTHNLFTQFYIYTTTLSTNNILTDFIDIIIRLNSNEPLMGAMWFCPMLLIVSILALIQLKYKRYIKSYISVLQMFSFFLLGSVMLYILHLKSPYCIWQNMIVTGIFLMGYFFHRYEYLLNSYTKQIFFFIIPCIIIYISVELKFYARLQPANIAKENPFIILFISTLGSLMVYSLSKIIRTYKISRLIAIIGDHSFSIMGLHFLAFKLISFFIIISNHYELSQISKFPTIQTSILWNLAYVLSGVTLPVIIAIFYSKIKRFIVKP